MALTGTSSRRPRLLVLRALGLGDFLTGVPALRALRRAFPTHELVLATPPSLEPLASLAGVADTLLPAHGLEPPAWEGPPPELVVNLHGRGPQSHELLGALHPGRLVAFANDDIGFRGPRWREDEHEVRRWCRLVEEGVGVPADPDDLLIDPPPEHPSTGRGAVVVHPGAASGSRRWPVERFAQVARWAAGTGHDVVVTGGPDEVCLAARVAALAGLPEHTLAAGRTDLAALAAVVARARLVVSGDTGVAHLASAFATPSVVLFGPVPPSRWGPPARGPHTVLWRGDGTGDPWGDTVDPALLRIEADEVVDAAQDRLVVSV